MIKLLKSIKYDLEFIRSHTLQPQWYKVFKIFLVLGVFLGFYLIFEVEKTIIFFTMFFTLSLFVHMTYRVKTNRFTKTWLDFVVIKEGEQTRAESIGKFYYMAIILNAIISFVVSQVSV